MEVTAEFAKAWFECWRLQRGTREQRLALERGEPQAIVATHGVVDELVAVGSVEAVNVLADLSEYAPEDVGQMLAFGPLEDLLSEHGDRLVDPIVAAARKRPRFAAALRSAFIDTDRLAPTTVQKLTPWMRQPNNADQ